MKRIFPVFSGLLILTLAGCVSMPTGPSVMVLPGSGISFDQFRNDDAVCQQYAFHQAGGTSPNQAGVSSGATSAAAGTALGAAAGAAIGGGQGALIGAGSGLLGGGLVGAGAAGTSMDIAQNRYDVAYIQCMYAKGHQVPVSGQFTTETPRRSAPPSSDIPPPPAGSPPPAPKK